MAIKKLKFKEGNKETEGVRMETANSLIEGAKSPSYIGINVFNDIEGDQAGINKIKDIYGEDTRWIYHGVFAWGGHCWERTALSPSRYLTVNLTSHLSCDAPIIIIPGSVVVFTISAFDSYQLPEQLTSQGINPNLINYDSSTGKVWFTMPDNDVTINGEERQPANLTFISRENNTKIAYKVLTLEENNSLINESQVYYSLDKGKNWTVWNPNELITLNQNDWIQVQNRGIISKGCSFYTNSGSVDILGEIASMVNHHDYTQDTLPEKNFAGLFSSWVSNSGNYSYANIINADHLVFPSYNGKSAYMAMFAGCINLESAKFSLENVPFGDNYRTEKCFLSMFIGCNNLLDSPVLPSINVSEYPPSCYSYMFSGCTRLRKAPKIIDVKHIGFAAFKENCFANMFDGCSNLRDLSDIGPLFIRGNHQDSDFNVSEYSFYHMFKGCNNLNITVEDVTSPPGIGCVFCYETGYGTIPAAACTEVFPNISILEQGKQYKCTSSLEKEKEEK